jgi:hypothetical protein
VFEKSQEQISLSFQTKHLRKGYHGPTAQNKHGAHYAGLIGSDEK